MDGYRSELSIDYCLSPVLYRFILIGYSLLGE